MKKILLSSLSVLALSVAGAMAQDSDDGNDDDGFAQVAGEGSTLAGNDGTNDGDDGNDNSVVNDQDQDNDVTTTSDGDDGDNRDNDMSDNSISDSGNVSRRW